MSAFNHDHMSDFELAEWERQIKRGKSINTIQRYKIKNNEFVESDDGAFCSYGGHLKYVEELESEVEQLKEEIKELNTELANATEVHHGD